MRNAGVDEAQAGVKIAGRNNNNLRYADDTTLKTESEDELKSLLMKVKEESGKKKKNPGLKLNILSRGSYHRQTVRVLLLLFQSRFLLYLFLLWLLWLKLPKLCLKSSGESVHLCLFPDFRGNAFNFSPLRIMFVYFIYLLKEPAFKICWFLH